MLPALVAAPALTPAAFRAIADLLGQTTGIQLATGKEGLVVSRLTKRLRALSLATFEDYLAHLERPGGAEERQFMLDLLTTNTTHFWREADHFAYLSAQVLPLMRQGTLPPTLWSAGCSSGEEPYTMAMLALGLDGDGRRPPGSPAWRVLATDFSTRILDAARRGVYAADSIQGLPPALQRAGFEAPTEGRVRVADAVRRLVSFAPLNLMEGWPMKGPFGAIFCRNVMIYFDRPTQERLIGRFVQLLAPGGYLFIGHSESIQGFQHGLQYVQPACYRRVPPGTPSRAAHG